MRLALRLARRGYGLTSPNPMVGAVLVKNHRIIGQGWHAWAGGPHAEMLALRDAQAKGSDPKGATLYVTLEPCCTQGRTPPCTDALIAAGIRRVVAAATDPNPAHLGRGFRILEKAGIEVSQGLLAQQATALNEAFNHWIVHRTPFVTLKAAMTLDGKIATAAGQSKWITAEPARAWAMRLRQGVDAILVGVNTVLADDPSLTVRSLRTPHSTLLLAQSAIGNRQSAIPSLRTPHSALRTPKRRIILDAQARTPLLARVVRDQYARRTTVVVTRSAPKQRRAALAARVQVWTAPGRGGKVALPWLLERLGAQAVTSLLVEGGGEVHASFLEHGLAHRVAFFYAPILLGARDARKAVAGLGAPDWAGVRRLCQLQWRQLGPDLLLCARVDKS
jgi:diaminohydroxyphosphoribosylaminopyrimidine deaminase/5-amino-6-(5-phosphoribosylamino)uracil reductase